MDFHSLPRRQLQTLCKKHGIPANSTNAEMANSLFELLKKTSQVEELYIKSCDPHVHASECIPERGSERNAEKVGKIERVTRATMKEKSTDVARNHISQKEVLTNCNGRLSSTKRKCSLVETDSSNISRQHLMVNTAIDSNGDSSSFVDPKIKSTSLIDSKVNSDYLSDLNGHSGFSANPKDDSTQFLASRKGREGHNVSRRTRANTRASVSHLPSPESNDEITTKEAAVKTSKDEIMPKEGQGTEQKSTLKPCLKVVNNRAEVRKKKGVVTFSDTVDIKQIDSSEKECSPLPVRKNTLRSYRKEIISVETKQIKRTFPMSAGQTSDEVSSVQKGKPSRRGVRKNHGEMDKENMLLKSFSQEPLKNNISRSLRNRESTFQHASRTTLNGKNKQEVRLKENGNGNCAADHIDKFSSEGSPKHSTLHGLNLHNDEILQKLEHQLEDTATNGHKSSLDSLNESSRIDGFLYKNNMSLRYNDQHHDYFSKNGETHSSEKSEQYDQDDIPYTDITVDFNCKDGSSHESNVNSDENEEVDYFCSSEHGHTYTSTNHEQSDHNKYFKQEIQDQILSFGIANEFRCEGPSHETDLGFNGNEKHCNFYSSANEETYTPEISQQLDHTGNFFSQAAEFLKIKEEFQDCLAHPEVEEDMANKKATFPLADYETSGEKGEGKIKNPDMKDDFLSTNEVNLFDSEGSLNTSRKIDDFGVELCNSLEESLENDSKSPLINKEVPLSENIDGFENDSICCSDPSKLKEGFAYYHPNLEITEEKGKDQANRTEMEHDSVCGSGVNLPNTCLNISIKNDEFADKLSENAEEYPEKECSSAVTDEEIPLLEFTDGYKDDPNFFANFTRFEEFQSGLPCPEIAENMAMKESSAPLADNNMCGEKRKDQVTEAVIEHDYLSVGEENLLDISLNTSIKNDDFADNLCERGEESLEKVSQHDSLRVGEENLFDISLNTSIKNDDFADNLSERAEESLEKVSSSAVTDEKVTEPENRDDYKHESICSSNYARNKEESQDGITLHEIAEDTQMKESHVPLMHSETSMGSRVDQVKEPDMEHDNLLDSEDNLSDTDLDECSLNISTKTGHFVEKLSHSVMESQRENKSTEKSSEKEDKNALADKKATCPVNKDGYEHDFFSARDKEELQDSVPYPEIAEDLPAKEASIPLVDNGTRGGKDEDKGKISDMECYSVHASEDNGHDIGLAGGSLSSSKCMDNFAEELLYNEEKSRDMSHKHEEAICSEHNDGYTQNDSRNETQEINEDKEDGIFESMEGEEKTSDGKDELFQHKGPNMNTVKMNPKYVFDGEVYESPDVVKTHYQIIETEHEIEACTQLVFPCCSFPSLGPNHIPSMHEVKLSSLRKDINVEEMEQNQPFTMVFHSCSQEEQSSVETVKVFLASEVEPGPELDLQKLLSQSLQVSPLTSESELSSVDIEGLEPIRSHLTSGDCEKERSHVLEPQILANCIAENISFEFDGTKIDSLGMFIATEGENISGKCEADPELAADHVKEQKVDSGNNVTEIDDGDIYASTNEEGTCPLNKDGFEHGSFCASDKEEYEDGNPCPEIAGDMIAMKASVQLTDDETCRGKVEDKVEIVYMEYDSLLAKESQQFHTTLTEGSLNSSVGIDKFVKESFDSTEESPEKECTGNKHEEARCSEQKEDKNEMQETNGDEENGILESMDSEDKSTDGGGEFFQNKDLDKISVKLNPDYVFDGEVCVSLDMLKTHYHMIMTEHDVEVCPQHILSCCSIPTLCTDNILSIDKVESKTPRWKFNVEEMKQNQPVTMVLQEEQRSVEAERVLLDSEASLGPELDHQKMPSENSEASLAISECESSFVRMETLEPIRQPHLMSGDCGQERSHIVQSQILTNSIAEIITYELEGKNFGSLRISSAAEGENIVEKFAADPGLGGDQMEEQLVDSGNNVFEIDDALGFPGQLDNCTITRDTWVEQVEGELSKVKDCNVKLRLLKEKDEVVHTEQRIRLKLNIEAGQNLKRESLHEEHCRMQSGNANNAAESKSSLQSRNVLEISKEESMKQIDLTLLSLRKLREACRKNCKSSQKSSSNELVVPKVNSSTFISPVSSYPKDVQSNKRSALTALSSNINTVSSVGMKTQQVRLNDRPSKEDVYNDGKKAIGFISPMNSIMD